MFFNLLEGEATQGNPLTTYLIFGGLILLIIVFFVYTTIANKKRQKKAQEMVDSVKPGVKIKTIGGICGVVVEVNDEENTIVIETGSGDSKSYVKFDKAAIYQVGTPEDNQENK